MKIRCKYDELIPVAKLRLIRNPLNANDHPDDQVKDLAHLMTVNGIRHPIIISNQTQTIQHGHGRLMAAQLNGWDVFPVEYQDFDTPAQQFSDEIADNTVAKRSKTRRDIISERICDHGPIFDLRDLALPDFTIDISEKLSLTDCPKCMGTGKVANRGNQK